MADDGPRILNDADLEAAKARLTTPPKPLSQRIEDFCRYLEDRFGLGERPSMRRKLYRRVARTCLPDETMWGLCLAVMQLADAANDPGRYFARSITCRIAESLGRDITARFRPAPPKN